MINHTIRDLELSPDENDLDVQLEVLLATMGVDDWALVSVLPTRHVTAPNGDIVVSSVRLIFKKQETQQPTYDAGVYARCGVKISVGEYEAALVVYCPDTWNGRDLEVEAGGTGRMAHNCPIETRITDTGPATSAVCTQLSIVVFDRSQLGYATYYVRLKTSDPEIDPGRSSIRLYKWTVTELDWRDRVIKSRRDKIF